MQGVIEGLIERFMVRILVSVDLSGPHKQSHAGNKYAVVVCAHLADGCDLPFVRGVPNKEAKTVTDALCDVLTQLVSFAGLRFASILIKERSLLRGLPRNDSRCSITFVLLRSPILIKVTVGLNN